MDRLTQDCDFCIICCSMENKKECAYWTGNITLKCGDAQIYETLMDYELIGLTPAEIEQLKAENARLIMERDAIRSRLHGLSYESVEWSHGEHPRVVELNEIDDIMDEFDEMARR